MRESLQWIGDGFRQIRPSIWVDKLFDRYKDSDDSNIIISDGRYFSELKAVKERGGVNVLMWRPVYENDIDHPSESQLKPTVDSFVKDKKFGRIKDDPYFDWFMVNDGDLESLEYKVSDKAFFDYVWDKVGI